MEQPGLGAHVGYYQSLLKEGKLSAGGPFLDGAGGVMISMPGASLAELEAFAGADPTVVSGLLLVEVHPWLVGLRSAVA